MDTDFNGNHGEYSIEHMLEQVKDGNLVIPEPGNDPNYDNVSQKIREAKIYIHLEVNPDGTINESKYRQTIAHELNHLRYDYEIRKATNNEWSLLKEFVMGNVDVGAVMNNIDNPITNIIYRLFIDTEWHALGAQMYADMYNLYKERGCKLDRRNAHDDINDTESMKEYNLVKEHFNVIVKRNPMFGNFAIRYFTKWYSRYMSSTDRSDKEQIVKKFSKWFIRLGEGRMKKVFLRIIKAAGLLYDDIEEPEQFTFESYYKKGKMITEMMDDDRRPADEIAVVFMVTESGDDIIPYTVRYNKLYVEDWFTPDEPSDWIL